MNDLQTPMPGASFPDKIAADLQQFVAAETPDTYGKRNGAATPEISAPSNLPHLAGASDLGQLSAEAIASEFETAARSIEAMSARLVSMAAQCDDDTLSAVRRNAEVKAMIGEAVDECAAAAEHFRTGAKTIFERIEASSAITEDVRRTVAEMCSRIAAR